MNKLKKFFLSEYLWLVFILFFAFMVRLYGVNNPLADWHSWRQADTASVSRIYLEKGINLFYPRYYDISSVQSGFYNPHGFRFVEFPLFNLFHTLLAKLGGPLTFEGWGRMTSIIFSLLSTIFVFILGRRFISKLGGLISAFFFAFLPYSVYYSRVILPEPTAVSFALFSIILFVRFMDNNRIIFLCLSSLFLAIAILVKPHAIFYVIPCLLLFLERNGLDGIFKSSQNFMRFLIFGTIAVLPFLLWRIWVNNFPAGIPFMEWSFNLGLIRFHPAFWRWIFGERIGVLILGVYGLFLFLLGLVQQEKGSNFIRFFFFGMFVYVSVFASTNVRHDYYQIFLVPSISLAMSYGSIVLVSKRNLLSLSILFFSIFMSFLMSLDKVKGYYQINHPEIVEAGKEVDRIAPKDARVIAPYNGDTAFLYQTGRFGWPVVDTSFEKLINERGASYYVTVDKESNDSKFIRNNYRIVKETDSFFIADLTQKL